MPGWIGGPAGGSPGANVWIGTSHRNDRPMVADRAIVPADTARRGLVRTDIPVASNAMLTVPSLSVRYTRAPADDSRSRVERAGWPYGLPAPAEATATRGRTVETNASVVAVRLP